MAASSSGASAESLERAPGRQVAHVGDVDVEAVLPPAPARSRGAAIAPAS